ncbi:helix-turn-helix domain-containing protein [Dolosicoccus paucivorans]|uniref:helix-turn-helix domain-containing protein n=1 Tax=Dolosicoccus paucivorans TaxID=84521 RepID=UPI0008908285|nr:helix-turn-helix transcriptional regulator [Dolosicoccus paucivorans]SDI40612.1 Helix-turn-helix [Dolosicoccus paucivorans]
MEVNKKLLGEEIKRIRISRLESQEEFSQKIREITRLKTGRSGVSKWEKGYNTPSKKALKAIAQLGNMRVEKLLANSGLKIVIPEGASNTLPVFLTEEEKFVLHKELLELTDNEIHKNWERNPEHVEKVRLLGEQLFG